MNLGDSTLDFSIHCGPGWYFRVCIVTTVVYLRAATASRSLGTD